MASSEAAQSAQANFSGEMDVASTRPHDGKNVFYYSQQRAGQAKNRGGTAGGEHLLFESFVMLALRARIEDGQDIFFHHNNFLFSCTHPMK